MQRQAYPPALVPKSARARCLHDTQAAALHTAAHVVLSKKRYLEGWRPSLWEVDRPAAYHGKGDASKGTAADSTTASTAAAAASARVWCLPRRLLAHLSPSWSWQLARFPCPRLRATSGTRRGMRMAKEVQSLFRGLGSKETEEASRAPVPRRESSSCLDPLLCASPSRVSSVAKRPLAPSPASPRCPSRGSWHRRPSASWSPSSRAWSRHARQDPHARGHGESPARAAGKTSHPHGRSASIEKL